MNKFILTHRPPFLSLSLSLSLSLFSLSSLSLSGEGERGWKRKNKKKVAERANFFMIRDGKEISCAFIQKKMAIRKINAGLYC